MKYQYSCPCGDFRIRRGNLTRKQYASKKELHASGSIKPRQVGCEILYDELKLSGKVGMPDRFTGAIEDE